MDSNLRKMDLNPYKSIWVQELKRMKSDSNPLHNNSNPGIWKCEENMKDSNLIYKMKLKVEGFKSLSYGFESLLSAQFKFLQRRFESSSYGFKSPFYRSIKCLIGVAIYSKFQKHSLSMASKCSQWSLTIIKVYILHEIFEDINYNILRVENHQEHSLLELSSTLSLYPLIERL